MTTAPAGLQALDDEVDVPADAWPDDTGNQRNRDLVAVVAGKKRMATVLEHLGVCTLARGARRTAIRSSPRSGSVSCGSAAKPNAER